MVELTTRDSTIVPAVCYAICDNVYLEAQKEGKTPALCASGSLFLADLDACQNCILANANNASVSLQNYTQPEFAPYLDFCAAQSAISATATATTTNPAQLSSIQQAASLQSSIESKASLVASVQSELAIAASLGLLTTTQGTATVFSTITTTPSAIPSSSK